MQLLIISHDASRTGAPILLLHLLRSYKKRNPTTKIDIIIGFDGPLVNEFSKVGNVFTYKRYRGVSNNIITRKFFKLFNAVGMNFRFTTKTVNDLRSFTNKRYDLVFSNTITNGSILKRLRLNEAKVVSYIHELENSIRTFTTPDALKFTLENTNHFLVPSYAVRVNLNTKHSVCDSKISYLNYYIPDYQIEDDAKDKIRKILDLSDEVVIGAVGTSDWRKGIDLFIQVALYVRKSGVVKNFKFVWIGATKIGLEYERLLHDIERSNLLSHIVIIDSVPNPLDYIAIMDIFLLTSREDPYPLVILEAAMLRKPIVSFANSGGASEFLYDEAGIIVPYLDTNAMAEATIRLMRSKSDIKFISDNAFSKFQSLHSEFSAVAVFEDYLSKFLK